MPILALDVEGTIITGYDYDVEIGGGRYPAIISPQLPNILKTFKDAGWIIVLATGTSGDNIEYYRGQFQTANIAQYIDAYMPGDHEASDSKVKKLHKYAEQYRVWNTNQIHFYDDGRGNVDDARLAGYNATRVSDETPLADVLARDVQNLIRQHQQPVATTTTVSPQAGPATDAQIDNDPVNKIFATMGAQRSATVSPSIWALMTAKDLSAIAGDDFGYVVTQTLKGPTNRQAVEFWDSLTPVDRQCVLNYILTKADKELNFDKVAENKGYSSAQVMLTRKNWIPTNELPLQAFTPDTERRKLASKLYADHGRSATEAWQSLLPAAREKYINDFGLKAPAVPVLELGACQDYSSLPPDVKSDISVATRTKRYQDPSHPDTEKYWNSLSYSDKLQALKDTPAIVQAAQQEAAHVAGADAAPDQDDTQRPSQGRGGCSVM